MNRVAVVAAKPPYPTSAPFHPQHSYPEYPFSGYVAAEENTAYEGVRRLFHELGLDAANYGSAAWNPLGHVVSPGMTVVIKPNFVLSRHKEGKDVYAIITHPSVLRVIADYTWIALNGAGKIIIGDAPQYDCNFEELLRTTHLADICAFYENRSAVQVEYRDLRNYWSAARHFPSMCLPLAGDPDGSVVVNLGDSSLLKPKRSDNLYGAVYHRQETIEHHSGTRQEYQVSRTILSAHAVISVPKLKVHKKVGVTLNAKGLVGINTNKNLIVHYSLRPPSRGGDQYPDGLFTPTEEALLTLERWMYDHFLARRSKPLEYLHRSMYWLHGKFIKPFGITVPQEKRLLDAGNWYGNDSAWRMVVDLMRIFYFADAEGRIHDTVQRNMFSVIDGIVGGENKGPLMPDPNPSGVLIGGENPLAVDLVATRVMGFEPFGLKMHATLLHDELHDFGVRSASDIEVRSPHEPWRDCLLDSVDRLLNYRPYPGWVGHIEIENTSDVRETALP